MAHVRYVKYLSMDTIFSKRTLVHCNSYRPNRFTIVLCSIDFLSNCQPAFVSQSKIPSPAQKAFWWYGISVFRPIGQLGQCNNEKKNGLIMSNFFRAVFSWNLLTFSTVFLLK